MSIGKNIIKARQKKGLSRKQLATQIGIGYSTLSNYEQGLREPNHDTLICLSKELSVTVDFLLGLPETIRGCFECGSDEQNLIKKYRSLSERDKKTVTNLIDSLTETESANKQEDLA